MNINLSSQELEVLDFSSALREQKKDKKNLFRVAERDEEEEEEEDPFLEREAAAEVEAMNASHNRINQCVHMEIFSNLISLNLSHNAVSEAETIMCFPPSLVYLDLSFNSLTSTSLVQTIGSSKVTRQSPSPKKKRNSSASPRFRSSFGHLHNLLELDLTGNQLGGPILIHSPTTVASAEEEEDEEEDVGNDNSVLLAAVKLEKWPKRIKGSSSPGQGEGLVVLDLEDNRLKLHGPFCYLADAPPSQLFKQQQTTNTSPYTVYSHEAVEEAWYTGRLIDQFPQWFPVLEELQISEKNDRPTFMVELDRSSLRDHGNAARQIPSTSELFIASLSLKMPRLRVMDNHGVPPPSQAAIMVSASRLPDNATSCDLTTPPSAAAAADEDRDLGSNLVDSRIAAPSRNNNNNNNGGGGAYDQVSRRRVLLHTHTGETQLGEERTDYMQQQQQQQQQQRQYREGTKSDDATRKFFQEERRSYGSSSHRENYSAGAEVEAADFKESLLREVHYQQQQQQQNASSSFSSRVMHCAPYATGLDISKAENKETHQSPFSGRMIEGRGRGETFDGSNSGGYKQPSFSFNDTNNNNGGGSRGRYEEEDSDHSTQEGGREEEEEDEEERERESGLVPDRRAPLADVPLIPSKAKVRVRQVPESGDDYSRGTAVSFRRKEEEEERGGQVSRNIVKKNANYGKQKNKEDDEEQNPESVALSALLRSAATSKGAAALYTERIDSLQNRIEVAERALKETSESNISMRSENEKLQLLLRGRRQNVALQLQETAAKKMQLQTLEQEVLRLKTKIQKNATELHHAAIAYELSGKKAAQTEEKKKGRSTSRNGNGRKLNFSSGSQMSPSPQELQRQREIERKRKFEEVKKKRAEGVGALDRSAVFRYDPMGEFREKEKREEEARREKAREVLRKKGRQQQSTTTTTSEPRTTKSAQIRALFTQQKLQQKQNELPEELREQPFDEKRNEYESEDYSGVLYPGGNVGVGTAGAPASSSYPYTSTAAPGATAAHGSTSSGRRKEGSASRSQQQQQQRSRSLEQRDHFNNNGMSNQNRNAARRSTEQQQQRENASSWQSFVVRNTNDNYAPRPTSAQQQQQQQQRPSAAHSVSPVKKRGPQAAAVSSSTRPHTSPSHNKNSNREQIIMIPRSGGAEHYVGEKGVPSTALPRLLEEKIGGWQDDVDMEDGINLSGEGAGYRRPISTALPREPQPSDGEGRDGGGRYYVSEVYIPSVTSGATAVAPSKERNFTVSADVAEGTRAQPIFPYSEREITDTVPLEELSLQQAQRSPSKKNQQRQQGIYEEKEENVVRHAEIKHSAIASPSVFMSSSSASGQRMAKERKNQGDYYFVGRDSSRAQPVVSSSSSSFQRKENSFSEEEERHEFSKEPQPTPEVVEFDVPLSLRAPAFRTDY